MAGWIKLYRDLLDNPIVCKDSDHFAVWNYLLLEATHTNQKKIFNKENIILKRGQIITGRKSISRHFGGNNKLNESKIQRILKLFESEHMIEQQTTNKNRLITVLKYNDYQGSEQQNEQPVNNERTTNEQPVNTNKNVKNLKNENNVIKKAVVYFENVALDNLFKDFLKQRKSPKVKNTERSIKLLLNKLEPFEDDIKIEMINNSLVSGWASIFPIKDNKFNKRGIVAKGVLPTDIEKPDWWDEYEKNRENKDKVSMRDRDKYCKVHNLNINNCPNDDIILKWFKEELA